jgi:hypothetical protein
MAPVWDEARVTADRLFMYNSGFVFVPEAKKAVLKQVGL